jgi:hypothetical protein
MAVALIGVKSNVRVKQALSYESKRNAVQQVTKTKLIALFAVVLLLFSWHKRVPVYPLQ